MLRNIISNTILDKYVISNYIAQNTSQILFCLFQMDRHTTSLSINCFNFSTQIQEVCLLGIIRTFIYLFIIIII